MGGGVRDAAVDILIPDQWSFCGSHRAAAVEQVGHLAAGEFPGGFAKDAVNGTAVISNCIPGIGFAVVVAITHRAAVDTADAADIVTDSRDRTIVDAAAHFTVEGITANAADVAAAVDRTIVDAAAHRTLEGIAADTADLVVAGNFASVGAAAHRTLALTADAADTLDAGDRAAVGAAAHRTGGITAYAAHVIIALKIGIRNRQVFYGSSTYYTSKETNITRSWRIHIQSGNGMVIAVKGTIIV